MTMIRLGVLASGRGSNFQAILDAIDSGTLNAQAVLLVTDNPGAYALERAKKHAVESLVLQPKHYSSRDDYYLAIREALHSREIDLVLLAGFMRIVGKPLIDAYRNRIMNIHPALLPSFPGLHGQKQANDYGVKISGCTVHFVDEGMDTGPIIVQAAVPAYSDDTEESLSERILSMEHKIYPEAVRLFAAGRLQVRGRKVHIAGLTPAGQSLLSSPLSSP